MQSALMGDPFEAGVEVGPIAREDLRRQLHDQVVRSVAWRSPAAHRRNHSGQERIFFTRRPFLLG